MSLPRETKGEFVFWGTLVLALVLYFVSSPTGLPWSGSTELALAWSGQVLELPHMPHPVWGYFVWLFGGHFVALSAVAAAVAGGLIGALVNRYFGWRVGLSAALAWVVMPGVWNRAVTGDVSLFKLCGVIVAVWLAHALVLFMTRRLRMLWKSAKAVGGDQTVHGVVVRRSWVNGIAAEVLLGAVVVFALVSVSFHDYQLGEAASAYARVMLDEAGDRLVILNGVADDQMIWEEARRNREAGAPGKDSRLLSFRTDVAYRTQLVARVRREWPTETNLWVAAQIGSAALADVAFRRHPDSVYTMTGKSTTPGKWAVRWGAMAPYLESRDPFLPLMRRAFAFEGNALANRLQGEGKLKEAWALYLRVYDEVDRGNASALVNLSDMLSRGLAVDVASRQRIERGMKELRREELTPERVSSLVASCGPVMSGSEVFAELRTQLEAQIAEMKKQGNAPALPPEWHSLVEWNNEMIKAHGEGNLERASRIARTILSRPEWRAYIPANAVMGSVMAAEGDLVAAETFFRLALGGQGAAAPQPVVMNDYADTLRRLGRYDEAEAFARRAVKETGGKEWLYELTLAQILRDAGKNPDEAKALVDGIMKRLPADMRSFVRKELGQ